eukprot:scaffold56536_cov40-Phaeocystis_antarctica.AAC.1
MCPSDILRNSDRPWSACLTPLPITCPKYLRFVVPGDSSPRGRLLRSLRQVKSGQSCTTASPHNRAAAGNLPARID